MTHDLIAQFVRDRDEALLSLDKERILAFFNKYRDQGIDFTFTTEQVFWAAVHKARLGISAASEGDREISRKWLRDNDFEIPPYDQPVQEG